MFDVLYIFIWYIKKKKKEKKQREFNSKLIHGRMCDNLEQT